MELEIAFQPIDTSNGGSHQAINEMSIFKVWSKVFFDTTNTHQELTFSLWNKRKQINRILSTLRHHCKDICSNKLSIVKIIYFEKQKEISFNIYLTSFLKNRFIFVNNSVLIQTSLNYLIEYQGDCNLSKSEWWRCSGLHSCLYKFLFHLSLK